MRLIPHQTERQIFALTILACVALLVPSFWIACQGVIHPALSEIVPLLFVSLFLTIGAFAGTRRIAWLALLAPLVCLPILYWYSTFIWDGSATWTNFRPNIFWRLYDGEDSRFLKLTNQIGIFYVVVTAIAFATSFVFDRLLGPVKLKNEGDLAAEQAGILNQSVDMAQSNEVDAEERPVSQPRNKVRSLIILAAILFGLQLIIRVASSRFGAADFLNVFPAMRSVLIPIGFLLIFILPAAFACRLRTFVAPLLGTFLIASGVVAISLQKSVAPNSLPFSHEGVVRFGVILGAVFFAMAIIVGTSNQKVSRSVSWLPAVGIAMFVMVLITIRTMDVPTFLISAQRFNLPIAKQVNDFHFSHTAKVNAAIVNANEMHVYIQFRNDIEIGSADNFFAGIRKPKQFTNYSYAIQNMPETIDLSSLQSASIRNINFADCTFRSEQLQASSMTGWSGFKNCTFPTLKPQKKIPAAARLYVESFSPGETAKLLNCLTSPKGKLLILGGGTSNTNHDDHLAILEWLKRGGQLSVRTWYGWNPEMFKLFPQDMDLSGVTVGMSKLKFDSNSANNPDDSIPADLSEVMLERNVRVNVRLPVFKEQWNLVVAIPGRFVNGINYESMMNSMTPNDSLQDSGLEWSNETQDGSCRRLYLPHCFETTFRLALPHDKLDSLSFDESWFKHEIPTPAMPTQHDLDVSQLATLTQLRELYFSRFANVTNLRSLKPLTNLETLQVSTTSKGFSAGLFPNLKHIRLYVEKQPSANLLNELAKIKKLESVLIVDTVGSVSKEKFQIAVDEHFDSTASITLIGPDVASHELAPERFKQHQERLRNKLIEKFQRDQGEKTDDAE
jgi:hypothetical protein